MTYLEEINKLRRLLQVAAYPRRGTAEDNYDRYEIAGLIHIECELEDVEPLKPDTYYAHERYTTEEGAKEGLATCAYAGKWEKAKAEVDLSARAVPDCTIGQYWDEVRLYFLELGGEWLSQVSKPAPIDWNAPLPRTAPPFEYREPQKVRQG